MARRAGKKGRAEGQTLVLADREADISKLSLASLNELGRGPLRCPRCGLGVRISFAKGAAQAIHEEPCGHEPEDAEAYRHRHALRGQLEQIFRTAAIASDVDLSGEIGRPCVADLALVSPAGARIVVFVWGREEHPKAETAELERDLRAAGLHPMWLLDGRRIRKRPGEETELRPLTLKKTETGLLALDRPLIYLGPEPRTIYRAYLPAPIVQLAHDERVKQIGRLKAAIRPYRLTQLRVREGQWAIETSIYDAPLPPPPPLPERLANLLASTS